MKDILAQKLVKRGVSLKNLTYGKVEPATGQSVRQKISLQQGIPIEKAKEIVRLVKDSKKKAQASIQGDTVRISSKDRDELQAIIALLRGQGYGPGIAVHQLSHQLIGTRLLPRSTIAGTRDRACWRNESPFPLSML